MPKTDIHPTYYPNATVTCSCGASYVIGATRESQKVDLCSNCHPFYSGNQKLIDTAGRVDRFREKMATAQSLQGKSKKTKEVVAEAPQAEVTPTEESTAPDQTADADEAIVDESTNEDEIETPQTDEADTGTDPADSDETGKEE